MGRKARHVSQGPRRSLGGNSSGVHLFLCVRYGHVAALLAGNESLLWQNVSISVVVILEKQKLLSEGLLCIAEIQNETLLNLVLDRLVTDLALDRHPESKMRVNFNITMMDLKCEYASVDVVSVLGTEQNITTHVNKWHVDADGVRQRYQGRNQAQKDIELFDTTVGKTLEELHEEAIDAVSLNPETLEYARREFEYVFVDFYASWYVKFRRHVSSAVMT